MGERTTTGATALCLRRSPPRPLHLPQTTEVTTLTTTSPARPTTRYPPTSRLPTTWWSGPTADPSASDAAVVTDYLHVSVGGRDGSSPVSTPLPSATVSPFVSSSDVSPVLSLSDDD